MENPGNQFERFKSRRLSVSRCRQIRGGGGRVIMEIVSVGNGICIIEKHTDLDNGERETELLILRAEECMV